MKIYELLSDIRKRDLVLPEFQREFVWSREQAKQLMVSLWKGYPVGSLLLWKTDDPPELKNMQELPERLGTVQVILDGQQRLTTLYILIEGEIPPYYKHEDIEVRITDLYYNLADGEFQYYQHLRMHGNPHWVNVVNCFNGGGIDTFEIARNSTKDPQAAFRQAQVYTNNLNRLKAIRSMDLPLQVVPYYAPLKDAIDIFDRVNSQGTKLTDADLALTHVTGNWPTARREIKAKIEKLVGRQFELDLKFMTRALTCVVTHHALFDWIHLEPRSALEEGWKRLSDILDYLVSILPSHAFIHSADDLNSSNTLIPLVAYLATNQGVFPNHRALRQAVNWLYAAHIWARYTAQTDQRLEHDVTVIAREEFPWDSLREQIIDQRGRIEVKPSDFEGRVAQHPLFRMSLILAKAHSAVDWFNGLPLATSAGRAYNIQYHHVFPQSVLYRNGYDPDNHLHRKVVNEIANRAFLTAETNVDISNRPPEEYLPEVEERYPGTLSRQCIPMDPYLWRTERYGDFLEARRRSLAQAINSLMAGLITEPEQPRERPVSELISLGEGPTMEFKSTLQWDVVHGQQNTGLRMSTLKNIAAFMNSDGGTIVIGVEDSGEVYGLDRDLHLLDNSWDRFLQLMSSLIVDHIGPEYSQLVRIRLEHVGEKSVCVVDVSRSSEPAFMKAGRGKEFYVRLGNTTRALDPEETVAYVEMHRGSD